LSVSLFTDLSKDLKIISPTHNRFIMKSSLVSIYRTLVIPSLTLMKKEGGDSSTKIVASRKHGYD